MNADLVQQAVLGSQDAWNLLLRSGADNLASAAKYQPAQTELTKDDFCEKDAQETFSERDANAALKPAEIVDPAHYIAYVIHISRLNKKFPHTAL